MLAVDTHLHLGGAMPVSFVWETIVKHGLYYLAKTEQDVCQAMQISRHEANDFHRFLSKFTILDNLPWTEQLIAESIKAVCAELQHAAIDYAFVDFSINKYMNLGWHKWQAIQFIHQCFAQYYPDKIGLILSLKYESLRHTQTQYAKLIENSVAADCLVGIDLVGDETFFDATFYAPLFRAWKLAGKLTRAHVGESHGSNNIRRAILEMGVSNIAHGIKIIQEPDLIEIAKEHGICFDLAISSNYKTGVVTSQQHPILEMYHAGLTMTLGSDDPVQCTTTLKDEYWLAHTHGLEMSECDQLRRNAIQLKERYA